MHVPYAYNGRALERQTALESYVQSAYGSGRAPRHGSGSSYPKQHRQQVAGRNKRTLGDPLGLTRFGVNLVELEPGAWSSQRHWHSAEDEFVFVVSGQITLVTEGGAFGEQSLSPSMCIAGGIPTANTVRPA